MSLNVRRVVTGKDSSGKAVVVSDGDAAQVHERKQMGITNCVLWSTDSAPAKLSDPTDGAEGELGILRPVNAVGLQPGMRLTVAAMFLDCPVRRVLVSPQVRISLLA